MMPYDVLRDELNQTDDLNSEVTYPSLGIITYNSPNEETRKRLKRHLAEKQNCRKKKLYLSFAGSF